MTPMDEARPGTWNQVGTLVFSRLNDLELQLAGVMERLRRSETAIAEINAREAVRRHDRDWLEWAGRHRGLVLALVGMVVLVALTQARPSLDERWVIGALLALAGVPVWEMIRAPAARGGNDVR